jgi:hypothetical protein
MATATRRGRSRKKIEDLEIPETTIKKASKRKLPAEEEDEALSKENVPRLPLATAKAENIVDSKQVKSISNNVVMIEHCKS